MRWWVVCVSNCGAGILAVALKSTGVEGVGNWMTLRKLVRMRREMTLWDPGWEGGQSHGRDGIGGGDGGTIYRRLYLYHFIFTVIIIAISSFLLFPLLLLPAFPFSSSLSFTEHLCHTSFYTKQFLRSGDP